MTREWKGDVSHVTADGAIIYLEAGQRVETYNTSGTLRMCLTMQGPTVMTLQQMEEDTADTEPPEHTA